MVETTTKKMESELEASKVFDFNLPNEICCEIFMYLDKKSLKNVTATCKLWFGIIRGNEKFSGHVKMKFTDLKDLSKTVTDSEWLRERWPSMRVLEVSLGNQFVPWKLLYKMTKFMELVPLQEEKDRSSLWKGISSSHMTLKVRYRSRFFVPTSPEYEIQHAKSVLQDNVINYKL